MLGLPAVCEITPGAGSFPSPHGNAHLVRIALMVCRSIGLEAATVIRARLDVIRSV